MASTGSIGTTRPIRKVTRARPKSVMGTLTAVAESACSRSRAAEGRLRAAAGGPAGAAGDAPGGVEAARVVSCRVMPW
ncbi:hypothetical protein [Teichococcus aestuarii]|uniref:hypothetical protein n=1 Tax=Teichococcus aestuarii TaxID=568898 RepID=UPI00360C9667